MTKPIQYGRSFLTRDKKIPLEILADEAIHKTYFVKPEGLFLVVSFGGRKYLIETFGDTWGLAEYIRAGLWDCIKTFGRLKIGSMYIGESCNKVLRIQFTK